jgi:WD40 repeat protein
LKVNVGLFSVAFSPNGGLLATGSDDGTIRFFDTRSRQEKAQILGHESYVYQCRFNARGDTLVTGGIDRSVRFWDVESRLACGVPLRHEGEVSVVLYTPGGRKLLTAAFDKTLRLWELTPPAIEDPKHPDRLRLSVEVRTGCRVDEDGNVVRLKQAEWLERQEKLFAMGGPCDAPTWDEYDAWEAQQPKQRR